MDDIADEEMLLRHIPGGTLWQAPGPRITRPISSFDLNATRLGYPVTRRRMTTPRRLLELVGGSRDKGSRVAAVLVAEVRALGLRVVSKPLPEDPGHAEIQSDGRIWMNTPAGRSFRCCSISWVKSREPWDRYRGRTRILAAISRLRLTGRPPTSTVTTPAEGWFSNTIAVTPTVKPPSRK